MFFSLEPLASDRRTPCHARYCSREMRLHQRVDASTGASGISSTTASNRYSASPPSISIRGCLRACKRSLRRLYRVQTVASYGVVSYGLWCPTGSNGVVSYGVVSYGLVVSTGSNGVVSTDCGFLRGGFLRGGLLRVAKPPCV